LSNQDFEPSNLDKSLISLLYAIICLEGQGCEATAELWTKSALNLCFHKLWVLQYHPIIIPALILPQDAKLNQPW